MLVLAAAAAAAVADAVVVVVTVTAKAVGSVAAVAAVASGAPVVRQAIEVEMDEMCSLSPLPLRWTTSPMTVVSYE